MSESRFRTHVRGSRLRRGLAGATTLALASFALAACESEAAPGSEGTTSEVSSTPTPRPDPVRVTSNLRERAAVPVDETVRVSAEGGSLTKAAAHSTPDKEKAAEPEFRRLRPYGGRREAASCLPA